MGGDVLNSSNKEPIKEKKVEAENVTAIEKPIVQSKKTHTITLEMPKIEPKKPQVMEMQNNNIVLEAENKPPFTNNHTAIPDKNLAKQATESHNETMKVAQGLFLSDKDQESETQHTAQPSIPLKLDIEKATNQGRNETQQGKEVG